MDIIEPTNLTALSAKLKRAMDLEPPMSIIVMNEIIAQIDQAISLRTQKDGEHSGYEIGSGRDD